MSEFAIFLCGNSSFFVEIVNKKGESIMEKIIDVKDRYFREIKNINDKLRQLEEGRIYDPSSGRYSQGDGSLHTNIIQLREMLNDLIDKVEYNKKSDEERLQESLRNI